MDWTLPGPSRFLDGVVESLARRRHAVVVLPEPVRAIDPIAPMRARLRSEDLGELTVLEVGPEVDEDPLRALVATLDLPKAAGVSVEAFLQTEEAPSRYLVLLGGDHGAKQRQEDFARLLAQAGEQAQVCGGCAFQMLAVVGGNFGLPPSNVYLSHHVWWGAVGQLDVEWVIEQWLRDAGAVGVADRYWAKALCRGLAPADPRLARRLLEDRPEDTEQVVTLLREYAGRLAPAEFPRNGTHSWRALAGEQRCGPPSEVVGRALWSKGWLDWVDGYGECFHAAALAAAGRDDEVERRLWQGQQEVILPLVERVRRALLYWVEREYGAKWIAELVDKLPEQEAEALETEIGALAHHLFRSRSRLHQRQPRLWETVSPLAWSWRGIRNELAHGRMIGFQQLASATDLFQKFADKASL